MMTDSSEPIAPLLERQTSRLLGQVALLVGRITSAALEREGAHRNHFAVLATLDAFGPMSQAGLSRRTGIDRSDMAAAVDDLVKHGSIGRSEDPSDRRRNVVAMTEKGKAHLRSLAETLQRAQGEAFAPLSPEELTTFSDLLKQLHRHHAGDRRDR